MFCFDEPSRASNTHPHLCLFGLCIPLLNEGEFNKTIWILSIWYSAVVNQIVSSSPPFCVFLMTNTGTITIKFVDVVNQIDFSFVY